MKEKKQALPDIYTSSWGPAETDIDLFLKVYLSAELTGEQKRFIEAMVSGKYMEGWFAGGNSSGKTWTAKFLAIWFAVYKKKPGKLPFSDLDRFQATPYNILCTGPENKQAMELWQHIEDGFKNSPILRHKIVSVTTGTRRNIHPAIETDDGVIIEAVGLHDKGRHVEGQSYDLILVNEPDDVKSLIHCYNKVLVQRTWRRGGLIGGFGTPKGKREFYMLWRAGRKELDGIPNKFYDSKVYSQYSDARSNPYVDQESIERAMVGKSEDWIRERVEGKFTESQFAAFQDIDIEACLDPELPNIIGRSTYHEYVHGLDFGRKGDYTAMVTWDVSVRPHVQVHTYRVGGGVATWEQIFEDVLRIYQKYGGDVIYDATGTGGDLQGDTLMDLGIPAFPYSFAGIGKKIALINNLQDYIARRKFKMPYIDYMVEELRMYPASMEDKDIRTDMVMALALAAWGAKDHAPLDAAEPINK